MRTNIVIDDALMDDALEATRLKTKQETVKLGLRTLVRLHRRADIKRFHGRLAWEGDLDPMRDDGRAR